MRDWWVNHKQTFRHEFEARELSLRQRLYFFSKIQMFLKNTGWPWA
jgi:hypothetical protein